MCGLPLLLLLLTPDVRALPQPPVFRGLPSISELARREGLPCAQFLVTTEDGYSLWLSRLGNSTGPPVLLQHGIFLAPDSWLTRGRNKDLAYMMVDSGYDVYLGTFRGTAFCEGHAQYPKSDARFWNYTFHEEGLYDLPAMIDAILLRTGAKDLIYIGHSLGTTALLVCASTRPEYNKKIRAAILLSPVAFAPRPFELASPIIRFNLAQRLNLFDLLKRVGNYEVWPRTEKTIQLIQDHCSSPPGQGFCMDFVGLIFGEHRANFDKDQFGYQFSFSPAGTSVHTIYHFSQLYTTNEFKYMDYGCSENLKKYDSCNPPHYRLDRISTPAYIFWSKNDYIISESAVMNLASKLPNVAKIVKVADDLFTHIDVILGENSKEQLYQPILETLASLK